MTATLIITAITSALTAGIITAVKEYRNHARLSAMAEHDKATRGSLGRPSRSI